MTTALLVYYSRLSRDRLQHELRRQGIEVYPISGRAPDAAEVARVHPADVVVVDRDVTDISVTVKGGEKLYQQGGAKLYH